MTKKVGLFWALIVYILVVGLIVVINSKPPVYKEGKSVVTDNAIAGAKAIYRKKTAEGVDFSAGPCLTNDLMPDWVVDLVHEPRQPIDDVPANQCPAFLEGRATHFVELDLSGNLVRVK